jgi:hypothetical protein
MYRVVDPALPFRLILFQPLPVQWKSFCFKAIRMESRGLSDVLLLLMCIPNLGHSRTAMLILDEGMAKKP